MAALEDAVAAPQPLAQVRPAGQPLRLPAGGQPPEEAALPRCTPDLPPPLVIDADRRELPLRIPTEVTWLRVLATPPGDAGSVLLDCMQCALEEAPPLPELPADPPPLLEGITRVTLGRVELWDRGQCSAWWLGQCRDCLAVYWCDDRGAETWPPQPG